MKVVYASRTGNIERFIKSCLNTLTGEVQKPSLLRIHTGEEKVDEKFILITYTTGIGELPEEVEKFLTHNNHNMSGVIGSGNRNWGAYFCNAAKIISSKYKTPILMNFELSGNSLDRERFIKILA